MPKQSHVYSARGGRNYKPVTGFDGKNHAALRKIGIDFGERDAQHLLAAFDEIQPTVTPGSISTPIQFLQNWLPGFVNIITAARQIDDLIGIMTAGEWRDEEIVYQELELTGTSVPYSDYGNIPLSSWNNAFVRRTVVRFEEGFETGILESERAGVLNIDSTRNKRESAALALEIRRNAIGFFGWNGGANLTYGFLNDPNLPAYVTAALGASGFTTWESKTFLEIQADLQGMIQRLRSASKDIVRPEKTPMTLAVATDAVDYLAKTSDFGISVKNWLNSTYPLIRVESAPELTDANGGASVAYLYADRIIDPLSTDGNQAIIQVVPMKFRTLGVQQKVKSVEEGYSNATAGSIAKRPYAIQRLTGI